MMMHFITTFQTSKELELLLQDVRLHPTIVIISFGKKENHIKAPVADTIVKEKN
jgi:phospholipid/cholesterol/gamma-HCH transport system substrate-binding protein